MTLRAWPGCVCLQLLLVACYFMLSLRGRRTALGVWINILYGLNTGALRPKRPAGVGGVARRGAGTAAWVTFCCRTRHPHSASHTQRTLTLSLTRSGHTRELTVQWRVPHSTASGPDGCEGTGGERYSTVLSQHSLSARDAPAAQASGSTACTCCCTIASWRTS